MQSFLFALNAVFPIILMVALGYCFKRIGVISLGFAKTGNKLVFHYFLPAMLFLNVYRIEGFGGMDFSYVFYVLAAVLLLFLLALPAVMALTHDSRRRGALLQGSFRSNYALIGIPLAASLYGDAGVVVASLLSAAVVPTFNVLAVISLSIFHDGGGQSPSVKGIARSIVKNPLIQSIAAGILAVVLRAVFDRCGIAFRLSDLTPIFQVLEYLSSLATPMALLMLGAQFEFSAVWELRREIVFGVLLRTVIVPVLGLGTAFLWFSDRFSGAHFAAFVAVFATPVAVSSVPMTQEMDGDVTLAGQLVVWTTLFSALTVFLASFFLRMAGIF